MVVGVSVRGMSVNVSAFQDGASRILFSLRLPADCDAERALREEAAFRTLFEGIAGRLRALYGAASAELLLCVPDCFGMRITVKHNDFYIRTWLGFTEISQWKTTHKMFFKAQTPAFRPVAQVACLINFPA